MRITLEIQDLSDWNILKPLLKRLKIKIIDKSSLEEKSSKGNALLKQFTEILSEEEATNLEAAIEKSKENPNDFFKSAGLFQSKAINAKTLRQEAWNLKK